MIVMQQYWVWRQDMIWILVGGAFKALKVAYVLQGELQAIRLANKLAIYLI